MISRFTLLKDLFYNSNTGLFKRRTPTLRLNIGDTVGCKGNHGYIVIALNGKNYLAHRLAWLAYYGDGPPKIIDHIDGDKTNNKIKNLRAVTKSQNNWNQKNPSKNNNSGEIGVSFNKRLNRFSASITKDYKKYHLGYFNTAIEASEAYKEAKKKMHIFNEDF